MTSVNRYTYTMSIDNGFIYSDWRARNSFSFILFHFNVKFSTEGNPSAKMLVFKGPSI